MNLVERVISDILLEEGLYINKSKTEKYEISRHSDIKWRKCKYQVSLISIEEGIKRRKDLVHDTYNTLEPNQTVRLRVFLYNSKAMDTHKDLEKTIDSLYR